jgi:hypothetical protein
MKIDFIYTRHQVARGALADGEANDKLYLLKNVSTLRLTYQIKLLAYRASQMDGILIIQVPSACRIHASLREFRKRYPSILRIEKVE